MVRMGMLREAIHLRPATSTTAARDANRALFIPPVLAATSRSAQAMATPEPRLELRVLRELCGLEAFSKAARGSAGTARRWPDSAQSSRQQTSSPGPGLEKAQP